MQEEQLWALWEVAWQAYSTLHKKGAPFTRDPLLQNPFASYFEMKGSSQKRRRQERQEGKEVEQLWYSLASKTQPQSFLLLSSSLSLLRAIFIMQIESSRKEQKRKARRQRS